MGKALMELNKQMKEKNMPPVTLNVIGGFALMLHDIRDINSQTDIDYVGAGIPAEIHAIADPIGIKYGLGKGWINNDVMLTDISMQNFEFATGELHFEPALDMEKMKINILSEDDLLRMKIIAIDTSCTAIELGGDFTRMKDIPDILQLMERQMMNYEDVETEYEDYINNPQTIKIIQTYEKSGSEGVNQYIGAMQTKNLGRLTEKRTERYERSAFMTNFLSNLYEKAGEKSNTPQKD
jgi:hypothetical protein